MTEDRRTCRPDGARILVFNFFAGLKPRGIPVYARELEACFLRLGVEHHELRAPQWIDRAPTAVQNLCFVLFEQLVAPIYARWLRCRLTVYPYNSGSVLDALAGRSVMVIHDLIPNRRNSGGLAGRYIRVCQAWHARLGRPIAAVSRHTLRQLSRIARYERCEKYLWANPFYAFEAALARSSHQPQQRNDDCRTILLCSGIGPNKDFRGALRLLRALPPDRGLRIRVFGFGDDSHLARRRLDILPAAWRERIVVLPKCSLEEVVREFSSCDVVWVHSMAEGFGRPVMEARMCGRPVVASDIGAFRQLRRFRHVHLYRGAGFAAALEAALDDARQGCCDRASAKSFNSQLEAEVARLLD
jgi:glycosyltransferase involved in cell wall biosynthesis